MSEVRVSAYDGSRLARSGKVAMSARNVYLGDPCLPRRLLWGSFEAASVTLHGVSRLLPAASGIPWREAANKIDAYTMFASGAGLLPDMSLVAVADQLQKLDRYRAVWAMEGAAYFYALRGGRLLASEARQVPQPVRLTMHTGAGLVWADSALRCARQQGLQRMVTGFWEHCFREALDGYHEAAFEALGLVAVTLYPHLISEIATSLEAAGEPQNALFWHGVGRGLYFLPLALLPSRAAHHRVDSLANQFPGSEEARANVFAGLAWAIILVNLRDPDVVLRWLQDCAGDIPRHEAIRNGMTSAIIAWLAASPEDPSVERFARFQPAIHSLGLWDSFAARACRDARCFEGALPAGLFRLRPLPA